MCYTGKCKYEYKKCPYDYVGECKLQGQEKPNDAYCVVIEDKIEEYYKERDNND